MKYQSELINEILGVRGHEKSSLHYESECVETWIEEAKGGYPKLCDYESEWLNYISTLDDTGGGEDPEPPIGEFPYETLTDVTEATVDNVVPYAYKSAILKGQTLVNLFNFNNEKNLGNCKLEFLDNQVVITGGLHASIYIPLKKSTTYTLFAKSRTNGRILFIQDYTNYGSKWVGTYTNANEITIYKFKTFDGDSNYGIMFYSSNGEGIYEDVMVLEGDYTNVDIPYFEGMQSVKIPVLITSNEDGTKTNILTVNEDVTLRSNGNVYDELDLLTGKLTQRIDEDGSVLTQEVVKTVELSIQDQNGKTLSAIKPIEGKMHLSTSGDTIKPLFSGEIPVEAIIQNLASFIDLGTDIDLETEE